MDSKIVNNFLIGPGRSGTSYLYNVLYKIGDNRIPVIKEPQFFDRKYDKGLEWYHELYSDGGRSLWDFSNRYYCNDLVPERIYQYNPNARIFIVCRDRGELFRSMLYFEYRKGKELSEIAEIIDLKYEESDIYKYLPKWERLFDDNVHVVPFESILNGSFLNDVFGVGFKDIPFDVDRNSQGIPRWRYVGKISKDIGKFLRIIGALRLLQVLKSSVLLKKIIFKSEARNFQLDKMISEYLSDKEI